MTTHVTIHLSLCLNEAQLLAAVRAGEAGIADDVARALDRRASGCCALNVDNASYILKAADRGSVCGVGNVDKTTCILKPDHDGYWSGRDEVRSQDPELQLLRTMAEHLCEVFLSELLVDGHTYAASRARTIDLLKTWRRTTAHRRSR